MSSILIIGILYNLIYNLLNMILIQTFSPEIFLSLFILVQLVFNAYLINNLQNNFPILEKEIFYQTLFILICILLLLINSNVEGFFSNNLFFNDTGTRSIKILIVISSIFILIPLIKNFKLQKLNFFEYFSLFLISILSLFLLTAACDMLSAYLVLEMQALTFYILSSFKRNSAFSTESGLKYFISGSFISGIFLFGCSIIYGCLGTLNLHDLTLLLLFPFDSDYLMFRNFLLIGFLLVIITFLFKLSVAPFHFWSPDVYEGAPLASTIIFAVLPKVALFHFLIKLLYVVKDSFPEISTLMLYCGFLTLILGTFFAIKQKRVKRLMIYSSIAQTGFLIIGLSAPYLNTLISVYFFLIVYIITSILMWNNISLFYTFQNKINLFYGKAQKPLFLSSLSNIFKTNSLWSFSIVVIFFSIAGIPPLSGFLTKFMILFSLISADQIISAFILIIISAISVFYYLRIIKIVFFESKDANLNIENSQIIFNDSFSFLNNLSIVILLFCLFFFFFFPTIPLLICEYIVLSSKFFYVS